MSHWEKPSYQTIKKTRFADDKIIVDFENGDKVELRKKSITPLDTYDVLWAQVQSSPYAITIPARPNSIEIPWNTIRVLTDTEFGKYLANRGEEQATLIITKIKVLRVRKGITGLELAKRVGVSPQTISRIEKGYNAGFATVIKILASMGYSLRDLADQESELDSEPASKTLNTLIRKLTSAGIDSNLRNKIIPKRIQNTLTSYNGEEPDLLLDEAASYVANVYGWKVNEIWNSPKLQIRNEPFKIPASANPSQAGAYLHYAFYLAKIVCKMQTTTVENNYSNYIDEFKINYSIKHKGIQLESLLKYIWQLGILVLPLKDAVSFHGASWNIDGKHVIVLKENTKAHAQWISDLLHAIYHVFAHLGEVNTSVIETEELAPYLNKANSAQELEANAFANQVLFGNKAEELTEKALGRANYKIEKLKNAVIKIANDEGIRVDFLSTYIAHRLSLQGENWWSTASEMQVVEPDPFVMATEILKQNISIIKLNRLDHDLLTSALSN